jgi:hypothetical protein
MNPASLGHLNAAVILLSARRVPGPVPPCIISPEIVLAM